MTDILSVLWDSTDDLHRRFDMFPPNTDAVVMVFQEESSEFYHEVGFHQAGQSAGDDLAREAADVIVTILAALTSRGISREEFEGAARAVAAKNNAKTRDTHHVNGAGKIQRKGRA